MELLASASMVQLLGGEWFHSSSPKGAEELYVIWRYVRSQRLQLGQLAVADAFVAKCLTQLLKSTLGGARGRVKHNDVARFDSGEERLDFGFEGSPARLRDGTVLRSELK